jgi:hypothetical protein
MRHAERARLSYRPAVCSKPDRAWGHYRAQAPQSSVARCGGPVRCGDLGPGQRTCGGDGATRSTINRSPCGPLRPGRSRLLPNLSVCIGEPAGEVEDACAHEVPIAFGRQVLRLAWPELSRTWDECCAESRRWLAELVPPWLWS